MKKYKNISFLILIMVVISLSISGCVEETPPIVYVGVVTEVKNDVRGGIFSSSETGYIILDNNTIINVHNIDHFNWEIGKKYRIITKQNKEYKYYEVRSIEKLED